MSTVVGAVEQTAVTGCCGHGVTHVAVAARGAREHSVSGDDATADVPRYLLREGPSPTPTGPRAGPTDVLDAVARAAVDTVDGAVAAVICVVHENAPATFAGSHPAATMLDAVQFAGGEGPSFEALCQCRTVRVDDVRAWDGGGTWRELAADAGLTGVIALPVSPDDDTAATLSLYRRSAGGWSAGDVADATAFTARLRDLIAAVSRFATDGRRPTGDLGTAGPRD